MAAAQYGKTVEALLSQLPDRAREVIERRYGLGGSDPETLESIGEGFGITRERVRQIEASGFTQLRETTEKSVRAHVREIEQHLRAHGDLRAEHHLFEDFASRTEPAFLQLLLDLGEPFTRHRETDDRHTVWTINPTRVSGAEAFAASVAGRLRALNRVLDEAAFWELVEDEARRKRLQLTQRARVSWVGISRAIAKGPRDMWGLTSSPEVTPRDVGDWAFIVLRGVREPVHFTDIVSHMNTLRSEHIVREGQPRSGRPAHPQTVHNALIKDDRFVLVGRGLYALREWGYEPGTVRDVISGILREAKHPLSRDEIVAKVASARRVQPNTIVLNLQNRAAFSRTADGRYVLRRA